MMFPFSKRPCYTCILMTNGCWKFTIGMDIISAQLSMTLMILRRTLWYIQKKIQTRKKEKRKIKWKNKINYNWDGNHQCALEYEDKNKSLFSFILFFLLPLFFFYLTLCSFFFLRLLFLLLHTAYLQERICNPISGTEFYSGWTHVRRALQRTPLGFFGTQNTLQCSNLPLYWRERP